jgi:sulfur-oxidizing protein SoxZ
MNEPMRIRSAVSGGITTVRVLITHPMEPGTRKDAAGALIPAHFITDFEARHQGRSVMTAQLSGSVSSNPLLVFRFKGGAVGDRLQLRWTDNRGESRSDEALIA